MTTGAPDQPWRERYAHPCAWDQDFPPLAMTDLFAASVAAHPGSALADFYGRTYSYAAVMREARAFAAGLQAAGLGKGDRVGLFLPNVPDLSSRLFRRDDGRGDGGQFLAALYRRGARGAGGRIRARGCWSRSTCRRCCPPPRGAARLAARRLVVGRLAAMLPRLRASPAPVRARPAVADPARARYLRLARVPARAEAPHPVDDRSRCATSLCCNIPAAPPARPKGAMLTHQNLSANARQIEAIDPAPARARRHRRGAAVLPCLRQCLRAQPHGAQRRLHRHAAALRRRTMPQGGVAQPGHVDARGADDVPGAARPPAPRRDRFLEPAGLHFRRRAAAGAGQAAVRGGDRGEAGRRLWPDRELGRGLGQSLRRRKSGRARSASRCRRRGCGCSTRRIPRAMRRRASRGNWRSRVRR